MGIKVLNTVASGGKTEWTVYKSREIAAGLLQTPYVLLPSRAQVEDFRRRLAKLGGTMGVYLGTFQDISREILDRSKINSIVLSETAQLKLVQSILDHLTLVHYQRIKGKPGFAQTLLAIIKELEAGKIKPDIFLKAVQKIDQEGRLKEFGLVYQNYRKLIQDNKWVDPTGLVWAAVENLDNKPVFAPNWDILFVDGFDDLSPVQMELVIKLSQILPDVVISITGTNDGSVRPLVHKRFNHLKAELAKYGQLEYIEPEKKDPEAKDGLFQKLEDILFTGEVEKPLEAGNRIEMVAVPDREGEVRAALRWIKSLKTNGIAELGQSALIMRTLEPYRGIIYKVAREYQLPVFIRGGLPLEENPAVAAILSLLELSNRGKNGLAWRDVISLWQSPYFDWSAISSERQQADHRVGHMVDAAHLSEIARWGSVIQGFEQWQEAFMRLMAIPADEEKSSENRSVPISVPIGEDAGRLWQKFVTFTELIFPPDDGLSVEEYVLWVENLLGDLNLDDGRSKGLNLFSMMYDGGPELFQRDCQAIKVLTEVFREHIWSDLMLGSEPTTFNALLRNLAAEIKSKSYQPVVDDGNHIICADCNEVRGIYYKAAALIGLAEGEFPGRITEDPFLRNEDRVILMNEFGFPLRLSTESAEAELFYEAAIRASDWLLLTRPRIADNGAPWQPSPYWEEMLRVSNIIPDLRTSRSVPPLEKSSSRSELFEVIAAAVSENRKEILREAKVRYPEYFRQVVTAQKVISTRSGRHGQRDMKYDGSLEHLSKNLHKRYPEEQVWSASRLENYQTCPLNFFFNNLLGLEKPEPPQEGLDARQLGNIYHHIMEDLYLDIGNDYDIQDLLSSVPDIARKVFDEAPDREGFRETAWWHHTQSEILTNIRHSLIVLEGMDESYRFFQAEQRFGIRHDSAPQLDIEVESQGVYHLRGLIDRVDINDQGNLRIIDYKTSSPFGFDNASVREGMKLQLPLYALAAQEGLQLGNVQEGFYFHVRSAQASSFKMSAFWNDGERGSRAAMKNAILKGWEAVSSIRNGKFSPRSPKNGCPEYCPAVDFCWSYRRKNW